MKKLFIVPAIVFAFGMTFSSIQATELSQVTAISQQDEKVQIKPDELPVKVKVTITGDTTVTALPIAEVWKVPQKDGSTHYEVIFLTGSEMKTTKKYDEKGNEIKE